MEKKFEITVKVKFNDYFTSKTTKMFFYHIHNNNFVELLTEEDIQFVLSNKTVLKFVSYSETVETFFTSEEIYRIGKYHLTEN